MICSNSHLFSWLMFWIFSQGWLGLAYTLGGAVCSWWFPEFRQANWQSSKSHISTLHMQIKTKKTLYGFTFETRFASEPNYFILLLNFVFSFQHFNHIFFLIFDELCTINVFSDIRIARNLILANLTFF